MFTVARMMQKLLHFQAPLQVAREPTSAIARVALIVEPLQCTVTFTTGSVQLKARRVTVSTSTLRSKMNSELQLID